MPAVGFLDRIRLIELARCVRETRLGPFRFGNERELDLLLAQRLPKAQEPALGELEHDGMRRVELTWGETIVRRGHLHRADRIFEREGMILYEVEFWPDSSAAAVQVRPPRDPAATPTDAIQALDREEAARAAAQQAFATLLLVRGISSSARAAVP